MLRRVRFSEGVGSSWWRALNFVWSGRGLIDPRWLSDNIVRKIGDGRSTDFWADSWLEVGPLARAFGRFYDLAVNKHISVADMFEAGWALNGNGWKWRRRLFVWEEELVAQCVGVLANFVLQGDATDRWVWNLHPLQSYSVRSAYSYLTASDGSSMEDFASFLWVKSVPLKVNIFIWRLFLNRLPTKDNLLRRGVIEVHQELCSTNCGKAEDVVHLFIQCDVYSQVWHLVLNWLGLSTALHVSLGGHAEQFAGVGGNSKTSRNLFTIIWVLFVIWKDQNDRIFQMGNDSGVTLLERIKLQTYWWLKSHYVLFVFDYPFWRLNPLFCLQAIM
ncbi:hypothetical protein TSUD_138910 [Trifolium subterraneum]|uniref:Reverse transcriptase zinc-binding domain-containing protein n=1 Tax=Trifolium subterraneum TaxID=3900 RepID=A0A2Z6PLS0_TRISU|nr:hypothetical protein TSUD_138910 [Trifolium subterraneum]